VNVGVDFREERNRVHLVEDVNVVDRPQRQQHLGAAALRHDRTIRSFVRFHGHVAVQPDNQDVAALRRYLVDSHLMVRDHGVYRRA